MRVFTDGQAPIPPAQLVQPERGWPAPRLVLPPGGAVPLTSETLDAQPGYSVPAAQSSTGLAKASQWHKAKSPETEAAGLC